MKCRHCGNGNFLPFANLENCPPSNSLLSAHALREAEVYYPLVVEVCDRCFLVQVDEHKRASEIFASDYVYFSSYSSSWLSHCESFAEAAIERFDLGSASRVVEIASNDGYLLQFFQRAGIPVLGIEPTANTAAAAQEKGIPTLIEFFGERLAREKLLADGRGADLIVGNNVFAHVPDINDFTAGLKVALAPNGVVSLEFPHLLRLIENTQFDTIYHEHFSYLSLKTTLSILERQKLKAIDVESLPTHGGSLRVFATHAEDPRNPSEAVARLLAEEHEYGLGGRDIYQAFQPKIDEVRSQFLAFLIEQRRAGKKVVGYGAAAKGNTLLNYCGIKGNELVSFVADLSRHKQGKFLPGSHLPVLAPSAIDEAKPDFVIIFPWNIRKEITAQLAHVRDWGGRFVVAIPELTVF